MVDLEITTLFWVNASPDCGQHGGIRLCKRDNSFFFPLGVGDGDQQCVAEHARMVCNTLGCTIYFFSAFKLCQ